MRIPYIKFVHELIFKNINAIIIIGKLEFEAEKKSIEKEVQRKTKLRQSVKSFSVGLFPRLPFFRLTFIPFHFFLPASFYLFKFSKIIN